MPSLQELNLKQIRQRLKEHSAKLSGRKKDLIKRLQFYEVNKASAATTTAPEKALLTPPSDSYRDLHAGMKNDVPTVTQKRIEEYLASFQKALDKKAKSLYEERYLRYVRVSNHCVPITYIQSSVWAEMRKSTTYLLDISLDKHGVVQEAQCECGAGMAPTAHCKHIVSVLYGLSNFGRTGEILTEVTCTQVLQTFHHAKAFKGSPMKSSDFSVLRGKMGYHFDPRPISFRKREGVHDNFKNACLNYQDSCRMPALQLIPPANPLALAEDHDYLEFSPIDKFFKDNLISSISVEEAMQLEADTRGQSCNKLWKETRLKHLTASNFGTICKATDRRNKAALASSLVTYKTIHAKSMEHGKMYESVAIEQYEKKYDVSVEKCGLFVSTTFPAIAASPDGAVGQHLLLEVKCPYSAHDKEISPQTVPYLNKVGDDLELSKKHDYYYQIQGQLFCTKRSKCHLVVFTSKDLKVLTVKYDKVFADEMVQKLKSFFEDYFKDALLNKFMFNNYFDFHFHQSQDA